MGLDHSAEENGNAALPAGPPIFRTIRSPISRHALHGSPKSVREQVLLETEEELPLRDRCGDRRVSRKGSKLTRIAATIYCEREGQKGILIGKKGQMLKGIGTSRACRSSVCWGRRSFSALRESATELA
jgi:GTPase Era involved in 16S rRNA processing